MLKSEMTTGTANTTPHVNLPPQSKGTHKSVMWQHNTLPLAFAAWANNAIVKSLSNFHSPIVIQDSARRWCKIDGASQRDQVGVSVPVQGKDYPETFQKIDKGNDAEANYDMGGNL